MTEKEKVGRHIAMVNLVCTLIFSLQLLYSFLTNLTRGGEIQTLLVLSKVIGGVLYQKLS